MSTAAIVMVISLLLLLGDGVSTANALAFESKTTNTKIPDISIATGLPNRVYNWIPKKLQSKNQLQQSQQSPPFKIRYQCNGDTKNGKPIVLVHGLFVHSDHWRKTLTNEMLLQQNYCIYALDLLGCGYSDRPAVGSDEANWCNGEIGRFDDNLGILQNIELGSSDGISKRIRNIELRHPVANSPYNFYTWSDLITDFCHDVVMKNNDDDKKKVSLVCNSIGTMSSLQAVIDSPDLYNGVLSISPNFRELHSAEVPMSQITMPLLRRFQKSLRESFGQPLFDALAKPEIVKKILMEPYHVLDSVDDELVEALLTPLIECEGAADVLFDTLSYSAGPLPEQQLSNFPLNKPVWIGYGHKDPWTPSRRVDALQHKFPTVVERVVGWDNVGHCPHDENPDTTVHPFLNEFLQRVNDVDDEATMTKSETEKKKLFFAE